MEENQMDLKNLDKTQIILIVMAFIGIIVMKLLMYDINGVLAGFLITFIAAAALFNHNKKIKKANLGEVNNAGSKN
jgi:hypothetical protein